MKYLICGKIKQKDFMGLKEYAKKIMTGFSESMGVLGDPNIVVGFDNLANFAKGYSSFLGAIDELLEDIEENNSFTGE